MNATAPSGYRIVSVIPGALRCPSDIFEEIEPIALEMFGLLNNGGTIEQFLDNEVLVDRLLRPAFGESGALLDAVIVEFQDACFAVDQGLVLPHESPSTLRTALTDAIDYLGLGDGVSESNDCVLALQLITIVGIMRLFLYEVWALQSTVTITVARDVPPVVEIEVPVVAPPLAPPAPVPNQSGALPAMTPGQVVVLVNGQAVTVDVAATATTLTVIGDGFTLGLAGDCTLGGCQITTDPTGRQILALDTEGRVRTTGTGFLPGSIVHVWLFSTPTYLGPVTVAADGTFAVAFPLPGIGAGTHTLQVNGISADGIERSANLGVLVEAPAEPAAPTAPELPATGTTPLTAWAILLTALGGLLAFRNRRLNFGGR